MVDVKPKGRSVWRIYFGKKYYRLKRYAAWCFDQKAMDLERHELFRTY